MDTLGNLLDKQLTVTLKINNTKDNQKSSNLKEQLSSLTSEIDEISNEIFSGRMDKKDSIRPQHKTY